MAMIFIIRTHVVDFCDKSCIYDSLTLLKNEEILGLGIRNETRIRLS